MRGLSKIETVVADNPIHIAILTVSDKGSRGERTDISKQVIMEMVKTLGIVTDYAIVPDEQNVIANKLREMTDVLGVDLILTTGGTGFSPRDVTPEATLQVIQRQTPGFNELMRAEGLKHTPRAALSRAVSGIRGRTLIINLPGSPKGVNESLGAILPILPHGLEILRGLSGDCAR